MYASEMEICCYSSVKYFVRIKFHLYHLVTILWGIFFLFSLSVMGRFFTILLYIVDESVQMNTLVF
jgi:hypothetical protein